jgi:hypothetical protein
LTLNDPASPISFSVLILHAVLFSLLPLLVHLSPYSTSSSSLSPTWRSVTQIFSSLAHSRPTECRQRPLSSLITLASPSFHHGFLCDLSSATGFFPSVQSPFVSQSLILLSSSIATHIRILYQSLSSGLYHCCRFTREPEETKLVHLPASRSRITRIKGPASLRLFSHDPPHSTNLLSSAQPGCPTDQESRKSSSDTDSDANPPFDSFTFVHFRRSSRRSLRLEPLPARLLRSLVCVVGCGELPPFTLPLSV